MSQPSLPRNRRTVLIAIVSLAVVAAGTGLWYLYLRPAGPAPVIQPSTGPTGSPSAPGASGAPSAANVGSPLPAGGLDGRWSVDPSIGSFGDFSGSFVGYRVQEELARVGANTAVGRTPDVTGTLTLVGTSLITAEFSAELARLTSDDNGRDGRVRSAMATGQFPTADFVLAGPVELGQLPAEGVEIGISVPGRLTIRGVTRDVSFPLRAMIRDGVLTVTGALEITLADYGIPKPESFLVLSIADTGTIEVQLRMVRV